jgi:hypothetical protein
MAIIPDRAKLTVLGLVAGLGVNSIVHIAQIGQRLHSLNAVSRSWYEMYDEQPFCRLQNDAGRQFSPHNSIVTKNGL